MIKKTRAKIAVLIFLLGISAGLSGCAAVIATGVVVAGATAYDVMTRYECPNCKRIIKKDSVVCPYCKKEISPLAKTEEKK